MQTGALIEQTGYGGSANIILYDLFKWAVSQTCLSRDDFPEFGLSDTQVKFLSIAMK